MATPPDPNWDAASWCDYFGQDLRASIQTDVAPLIRGRGLFGIPRQFFCYVDYLGFLRAGPTWRGTTKKRKDLATTKKAEQFLREVFAQIDPRYGTLDRPLIAIYRQGLVHGFRPGVIEAKTSGQKLTWRIYLGTRHAEAKGDFEHLRINRDFEPGVDLLDLSANCLVEDLEAALEVFRQEIEDEAAAGERVFSTSCKAQPPN